MNFSAGLNLFTKLLKNLGSVFGCHSDSLIRIYDIVSFSNLATITLVQWLSQIIKHTDLENFSRIFSNWDGVNVQWIYPGSISDSNITEKSLMWLAGLRKNVKSCQIKRSLNSLWQKNNPVFRNYWYWLLQQAFILKDSLGVLVIGIY